MALSIALSGLNAANSDLSVIANNIANASTVGFKGSQAEFADVYSSTGAGQSNTAIGEGVNLADVAQQFQQGDVQNTQNALDMAITGNGFFTVDGSNGIAYTRAGDFQQDANGFVVTPGGQNLQVFPPTANGGFNTGTLQNLQILNTQGTANPTSNVQLAFNLPADATPPTTAPFNPADPSTFNEAIPFTVYDSQGVQHSATAYFVAGAAGSNQWTVNLTLDGQATPVETGTIAFNSDGALSTSPPTLTFSGVATSNAGAAPLNLTLNLAQATQTGIAFSTGAINQDGYAPGQVTGVSVSSSGVVAAQYSNGQSKALGQLALANFANPQGLSQLNNTDWAASAESGEPVYGAAGSNGVGQVQSSALESSNTSDVTSQLVNMITAQSNYEANAKVITTNQQTMNALMSAVT
ncbi:MAG TPA: flagellar hook protein FlgE [Rhodanobacteraceae bacterium]|nr:flagellar hook protein FlgE [Rhodanobacteraceae bacterium]